MLLRQPEVAPPTTDDDGNVHVVDKPQFLVWAWNDPPGPNWLDMKCGKRIKFDVSADLESAAILQGFPETWQFIGKTAKARWQLIGGAMPSQLSNAVATSIVKWFKENG